jgi:hypothetical protein
MSLKNLHEPLLAEVPPISTQSLPSRAPSDHEFGDKRWIFYLPIPANPVLTNLYRWLTETLRQYLVKGGTMEVGEQHMKDKISMLLINGSLALMLLATAAFSVYPS